MDEKETKDLQSETENEEKDPKTEAGHGLETDDAGEDKDDKETETKEDDDEKDGKEADDDDGSQGDEDDQDDPLTVADISKNARQHDADLQDEREEIEDEEKSFGRVKDKLLDQLPDIKDGKGKSIYEMTPEEFEDVIVQTYRVQDKKEDAEKIVEQAREARKTYLKEIKPYAGSINETYAKAEKLRAKEWNLAIDEVRKLYPGITKEQEDHIKHLAVKELESNPLKVDRVNRGVVQKVRYLIGLTKESGIEDKLTKAEIKAEQGNRDKILAGKGKKSSKTARETVYTPDQIKGMRTKSLSNWKDERKKIVASMKRGKK